MTKLYYDCPIESAYMAKNFGVEFCDRDNNKLTYMTGDIFVYTDPRRFPMYQYDEYYIHPDSLHIFEPIEGDLTADFFGDIGYRNFHQEGAVEEIIQRNDMAFIMPKVEKDD